MAARWQLAIVVVLSAIAAASCGKKGPPLPPIVHIPTAVDQISARRVGSDVFVTLTVPAENVDKTMPADVGRIEVYGYTGTSQPPKGRFLDVATHVATIDVLPPETDGGTKKSKAAPATQTNAPVERGLPPSPNGSGATGQSARPANANVEAKQGAPVTVRDHLDADALVARALPPGPVTPASRRARTQPSTTAPVKEGPLKRYYLGLAFSPRGRPGPPGNFAELALSILPDPPRDVLATLASDAITLTWEPSGGVVGVLLEQPLPFESSPVDEPAGGDGSSRAPAADVPPGPTLYNIYREIEPLAGAASETAETNAVPSPVNGSPLTDWTFSEPLPLLDGRRRCYTVRGVRGTGASAIEGDASVPVCIRPTDDVAPAAPIGLTLDVGVAGQITLTWEPNAETDLAGYVVLRGEAGDATLTPLTGSVIAEPRFVDQTVKPGVRYVYAVKAIDSHLPTPNVSAESARLEETAR
jgi:predicted small lipoprotein YifL